MEVAKGVPGTEGRAKKRTGTSKYDFFKVKVWLGENMDHYYVLSRFLICRMLTVTKIPYIKAVKIALETKKFLVDNNLQDVTQAELENVLFSIIRSKGFDEQYIDCYRMVTQFYQQRQPLCIIVCGAAWTGKSTIAQQLASRINIPNVMQTDVIYELLRAGGDSPLNPTALWCRPGLSDTALVAEFRREACVVRKGMDGDLIKTLSDGKPIIIEGMHLDPGLYIQDFGRRGIIMLPAKPAAGLSPVRRAAHSPAQGAAATAAQQPAGVVGKPGYRRSLTVPSRREASLAAETPDGAAAAAYPSGDSMQQQQGIMCSRSMSAGVDFSRAGPPAAATGVCRLPPTPEVPDAQATESINAAAVGEVQLQQQVDGFRRQQGEGQPPQQQQIQQLGEDSSTDMNSITTTPTSGLQPEPHVLALASNGQDDDSCRTQHSWTSEGRSNTGTGSSSSTSTAFFITGMQGTNTLNSTGNKRDSQQPTDVSGFGLAASVEGQSQGGTSAGAAATDTVFLEATVGTSISKVANGQQTALAAAAAAAAATCVQMPAAVTAIPAAAPAAAADLSRSQFCSGPCGPLDPPAVVMLGELQVCAATAEAFALQQHWQQYQQQQPHSHSQQQQQQLGLAPPDSPYSSADSEGGPRASPSLSQEHSTTEVVSRQQSCCSPLLSQEPSASELGLVGGSSGVLSTSHSGGHAVMDIAARQQELQGQEAQQEPGIQPEQQQHGLMQWLQPDPQQLQQQQQQEVGVQGSQQGKRRNKLTEGRHQQQQQYQHQRHCYEAQCHSSHRMFNSHAACDFVANGVASPAATASNGSDNCSAGTELQQLLQPQKPEAAAVVDELPAMKQDATAAIDKLGIKRRQQHLQQQQQQQKSPDDGCSPSLTLTVDPMAAAVAAAADAASDGASGLGASTASGVTPSTPDQETLQAGDAASSSMAEKQGSRAGAQQDKREPVQRPLFVPILVYMDEADHALMQEEALAHCALPENQPSSETAAADRASTGNGLAAANDAGSTIASRNSVGMQVGAPEALRRMRLLQEYLCAYEAQGLPVVKVSYGNFGEALDKLHEYILQCIKCAQSTIL